MKMLERRLDCLRTGVGVEEAATVSMRSSRWLTLVGTLGSPGRDGLQSRGGLWGCLAPAFCATVSTWVLSTLCGSSSNRD